MRASGLVAVLLLAPLAAASQPTAPWEFEGSSVSGSGAVGETIDVTVRIRANSALDTMIAFRTPDWVAVEGRPWEARASAGQVIENTWRVTPTQEGFWAAIAHSTAPGDATACTCALGFASGAPESIVGSTPETAVPVPILDRTLSTSQQEDGTARLERAILPVSSWLGRAEVHGWITPGSTYLCGECAVRGPDPQHEARGPGNETLNVVATLPLQDGEAYTLWDEVIVTFAAPDDLAAPTARIATGCENRRWGTDESWSCEEASEEWSHMRSPRARVGSGGPLAGVSITVFAILLASLVTPRRASRRMPEM